MSCNGETERALKAGGLRRTVPRALVVSALRHAGGHRTIEEIHALVAETDPDARLPLSTVYRTLGTLRELRLVGEVDAGGRVAYEWLDAEQPHHHLVCQRCGAESALEPELVERLAAEVRATTGFEAHLDHFSLSGRCGACREDAPGGGAA